MSRISGKDTKPEVLVRKYLFSQGFRFRKNVKDLNGKPDIVLPKHKSVVFVHGCFWHGHKACRRASIPQTNREFWIRKIGGNIERDKRWVKELRELGWKVLVVWQCPTKSLPKLQRQLT